MRPMEIGSLRGEGPNIRQGEGPSKSSKKKRRVGLKMKGKFLVDPEKVRYNERT